MSGRSNPAIKLADSLLGRGALALLGVHDWLRRLINPAYRPQRWSPECVETILVNKLCCLGDAVLAVPAVRALHRRWPDASIIVLCTPRNEAVFSGLPFVSELLVLPVTGLGGVTEIVANTGRLLSMLYELRHRRPQLAVDLDLYYRATPIFGYISGAQIRAGFDTEGCDRARLFTHSVARARHKWEVECFLEVAGAVGAGTDDRRLQLEISQAADTEARKTLDDYGLGGQNFVAFCPGSSKNWPAKQWPAERFVAVIDWLQNNRDIPAVLVGAEFEKPLCEKIAGQNIEPAVNLAGRVDIPQLAAILRQAVCLVTNDTGPAHIAAAVGTPVVAIFGPTDERKWGPRGDQHATVVADNCDCRPCYYLSSMPDCDDRKCLLAIEPEDVIGAVEAILNSACSSSAGR